MEIEKFDKLNSLFKNNKKKFFAYVLFSLSILVFIAYVTGFFSEKGKQHATTKTEEKLNPSKVDKTAGDIKEKQSLSGTILDQNGEPMSGVTVTIKAFGVKEMTDGQGGFLFEFEAEKHSSVRLMAQKEGYATYRQDATLGNVHLSFQMRRKP